jgi:hypothetical protein
MLGDESPVDCPLVEKLAGEVECTSEIGSWVGEKEGVGDEEVDEEHVEEVDEGLDKTELFDQDEDDPWEIEQDVHLDGEGEARGNDKKEEWVGMEREDGPVENGACEFVADGVGVHCGQRSGRGPAVVEEAEDVDGMQALAEGEKEENIVWYAPAPIVYQGCDILGSEVEGGVDGLDGGE